MEIVIIVLLIIGALLFLAATFNVPARWNLVAAGLFVWILTEIIARLAAHVAVR